MRYPAQTLLPADYTTSFEYQIRDAHLFVEASAWADHEGIYRTHIDSVTLDGVDVMGLLTDYDYTEINSYIETAIQNDYEDEEYWK